MVRPQTHHNNNITSVHFEEHQVLPSQGFGAAIQGATMNDTSPLATQIVSGVKEWNPQLSPCPFDTETKLYIKHHLCHSKFQIVFLMKMCMI